MTGRRLLILFFGGSFGVARYNNAANQKQQQSFRMHYHPCKCFAIEDWMVGNRYSCDWFSISLRSSCFHFGEHGTNDNRSWVHDPPATVRRNNRLTHHIHIHTCCASTIVFRESESTTLWLPPNRYVILLFTFNRIENWKKKNNLLIPRRDIVLDRGIEDLRRCRFSIWLI